MVIDRKNIMAQALIFMIIILSEAPEPEIRQSKLEKMFADN